VLHHVGQPGRQQLAQPLLELGSPEHGGEPFTGTVRIAPAPGKLELAVDLCLRLGKQRPRGRASGFGGALDVTQCDKSTPFDAAAREQDLMAFSEAFSGGRKSRA
jgi:hypothetical protein